MTKNSVTKTKWQQAGVGRITCKPTNKALFYHDVVLIQLTREILGALQGGAFSNSEMQEDFNTYGPDGFAIDCVAHGEESCGSYFAREALVEKFKSEWPGELYIWTGNLYIDRDF